MRSTGTAENATLALVQVTLATTGEIALGEVRRRLDHGPRVPRRLGAVHGGVARRRRRVGPRLMLVSLVVLIVEIGVVAAIGCRAQRASWPVQLFLGGRHLPHRLGLRLRHAHRVRPRRARRAVRRPRRTTARVCTTPTERSRPPCGDWEVYWHHAALRLRVVGARGEPFVVLADATPTSFNTERYPVDMRLAGSHRRCGRRSWPRSWRPRGTIAIRRRRTACIRPPRRSWRRPRRAGSSASGRRSSSPPACSRGAGRAPRTPARRLPPGTRIA